MSAMNKMFPFGSQNIVKGYLQNISPSAYLPITFIRVSRGLHCAKTYSCVPLFRENEFPKQAVSHSLGKSHRKEFMAKLNSLFENENLKLLNCKMIKELDIFEAEEAHHARTPGSTV